MQMIAARTAVALTAAWLAALAACGHVASSAPGTSENDAGGPHDDYTDACLCGAEDAGAPLCPQPVPGSAIAPWAPAAQQLGACSQKDLDTLAQNLIDVPPWSQTYDALSTQKCKDCVFSAFGASNWQPLVFTPASAFPPNESSSAFFNYAACYQLVMGGSTACAKAQSDDRFCVEYACGTCGVPNDCPAQVSKSECLAPATAFANDCADVLAHYAKACTDKRAILNLVCGDGTIAADPSDAGSSDAGAD